MAKKKRSAPAKTCPACQTVQHVATKVCKACGHEFATPSATKTKTTVRSQPRKDASLDVAIDYVKAAGGVDKARKMLDTIDAIKQLK